MDIAYRPATPGDLGPAARLVQRAINDLRARHGFGPAMPPPGPSPFQAFCLAENPDGLWVAEANGAVVGIGFGWIRGSFWFLAQLFVEPGLQAKGVGQALLHEASRLPRRGGADNRALITFAYNARAVGLYVRNGMYPREPLFRVTAPAPIVAQKLAVAGHGSPAMPPWPEAREWLGQVDEELLGFRRDTQHRFLLEGGAARGVRIERAGNPAGYAYISLDGHVGPLAVAPGADAKAVAEAAIRCALENRPRQISMIVPGSADRVLATLWELGFRIEEPYVLLSEKPFGNWRSYLPSNPGYM